MKKNIITNIQNLVPQDYFEKADKFRITLVGLYEQQGTKPHRYEVFEISCCMKGLSDFWSIPFRFVSDEITQNELIDLLIKKGKNVICPNPQAYLGDGKRLLYRDIKNLPVLKLEGMKN